MKDARYRRERSYATLFLACLLLLVRLGADVHLATVRHAVCEVHDELIEVDACGPASVRHASTGDASPEGCHVDALAAESGHEHCLLAQLGRDGASDLHLRAARLGGEPSRAAAPRPRAHERVAGIPVFLLAPKHSPPSRGKTTG